MISGLKIAWNGKMKVEEQRAERSVQAINS